MPILYEALFFELDESLLYEHPKVQNILRYSKHNLVHVRAITFEASVRKYLNGRSYQSYEPAYRNGIWQTNTIVYTGKYLAHLGQDVMQFMDCPNDNSLRRFR